LSPESDDRLRKGELIVDRVYEPTGNRDLPEISGALLHHWRATAFEPGGKEADFERILRDFDAYPQLFAPQVVRARVLRRNGDELEASMRVRQKHVITVVMDSTYKVIFERLDPQDGYSSSRSEHIEEVEGAGTDHERVLAASEDHGFLWRQNTYWSYAERDGGLYIQIESVSLSRSIPAGLGWAVRPFVESVPRDSLEFTLRGVLAPLRQSSVAR